MDTLIEQADKVYLEHFPATAAFERSLFYSWYCSIRDCKFCYMSTLPKTLNREARRSPASMFAETLLIKKLGWDFGFFSGGISVYQPDEFFDLLKKIYEVIGEKIWINIGATSKKNLEKYQPYIRGVVGSIETVDPELHKEVCPSKPMLPYLKMFEAAQELGLERGITFICGLGETEKDFELLANMIQTYDITKIYLYGVNPVPGGHYKESPSPAYHAWWIAKLRIAFPKLHIQCGIWKDKVERVSLLLQAGANGISKFPAIRSFGKPEAYELEKQCTQAGRVFQGSLTQLPDVDWQAEISKLPFDTELKQQIQEKLDRYLTTMKKSLPILHS